MRSLILLAAGLCLAQEPAPWVETRAAAWPEATPESQGIDPSGLEKAAAYLLEKKPAAASLLVVRNGKLVFERYWEPAARDRAGNVKSICKSVLSALTGIAVSEGRLGLDDPVRKYIPAAPAALRIRHLLTMTAGFPWAENKQVTTDWFSSPDPNRFVLSLPPAAPPGERFEYSTAVTHLLSTVLTRATGQSTLEYAEARLFQPLGVRCPRWDRLAGIHFGGAELWLAPRDLARFGQLYLQNGQWENRQIIPQSWVAESTTPKAEPYYGYLWWLNNPKNHPMICASGVWGQITCILPDLDMVVVHTSRPAHGRIADAIALDMIPRHIMPATKP
jgi:CubicO group peptidase (beta-lactamase class C family)